MARLKLATAGLLLGAAFVTPASAQQPGAAAQPMRIAYINSALILANTPGRAAAESLFAREMAVARTEVQRLQATMDSAEAEYNRTQVVMTPAARTTRQNELRQLGERNRARAQQLEEQMQAREQELTAPIMQRINAVIEGIRAEFNYAIIFDVGGQGQSIITADRSLDISAFVVQRLQAGATPGAPAPGATAPATTPADSTPRPAQPAGPRNRPRP